MSDALINGLAGAGGGIIAQLLTYPLQTVSLHHVYDLPKLYFLFLFPLFLTYFAILLGDLR